MGTEVSVVKGALKLGTGEGIAQVCSFARNVILARIISPEDFGIAATFAMTFSFLEMMSNFAPDKMLVQAPDGEASGLQGNAHLLMVLRGLTNAVLLFLLAGPLSSLFGVPQARWAFRCLAIIPLTRGFKHLDLDRFQRQMRFGPRVVVDSSIALLLTALAWPVAVWLRDYSAMLWLLIAQAVLTVLGSFLAAERAYSWTWEREYAKRFAAFGWPLLINGLLMYGIFHGDRFIIGSSQRLFPHSVFTMADLGVYSVAFSLTMAPSMFFNNVVSSLFLPLLSRAQASRAQFELHYSGCAQVLSFAALMISVPLILGGGWIVPWIYGAKYQSASSIVGWLAAMWALRLFRAAPTIAAVALADTRNAMIANITRTLALVGMVAVAANGGNLRLIAVCGFLGEVVATVVCISRLWRVQHLPVSLSVKPLAVFLAAALAALGTTGVFSPLQAGMMIFISLGACALSMLLLFPNLRGNLQGALFPLGVRRSEE